MPLWALFERVKDVGHPDEQMLSVYRDHGVVVKGDRSDNFNKTAENRNIYQLIKPGWLVVNRMKAWQGSLGISSHRGIVSGHYLCFRPRHSEDPRFLHYLLRSPEYSATLRRLSRGVRPSQIEIDNDGLRVLPLVLPDLQAQRAIADYLDNETARIDALVEAKRMLLSLVHERFIGAADLALWGDSPLIPLRHLVREIVVGIVVQPASWYTDVGIPAVRAIDIAPFQIDTTSLVHLTEEGHRLHPKSRLAEGDVVVVRTGKAGAAAVVPPGLGPANCISNVIVRCGPGLLPRFLEAVLNSRRAQQAISEESVGAIQQHFGVDAARSLAVPLVPLETQRARLASFDTERQRVEALRSALERQIRLLIEHRQALIAAAVMGEFEVPGAAA